VTLFLAENAHLFVALKVVAWSLVQSLKQILVWSFHRFGKKSVFVSFAWNTSSVEA
jgi:hypothetical protein